MGEAIFKRQAMFQKTAVKQKSDCYNFLFKISDKHPIKSIKFVFQVCEAYSSFPGVENNCYSVLVDGPQKIFQMSFKHSNNTIRLYLSVGTWPPS